MSIIREWIERLDDWQGRFGPTPCTDAPGLIVLAAHTVFPDRAALESALVHPQQTLMADDLRRTIAHFQGAGYEFIAGDRLDVGLEPQRRYCMLTFDDGYWNQFAILPLLKELGVPAVFFVVPGQTEAGESFWWDVVYRKGRAGGKSESEIERFIATAKQIHPRQIRAHLTAAGIGARDFHCRSDIDRPVTKQELAALAGATGVTIGNHTNHHEILTRCTAEDQHATLRAAQESIFEICRIRPRILAYPNGDHSTESHAAAAAAGLSWGMTLDERREAPGKLSGARRWQIGRYLIWGGDVERHSRRIRLRHSLGSLARAGRGLLTRIPRVAPQDVPESEEI
jgi:peptidoglycan/xylan/chitin deacetylase (PgdA/CDA1 family)